MAVRRRLSSDGQTSGDPAARQAGWARPVLLPLLGIPAFIVAILVSGLVPTPPDFCGQPHGLTCLQASAQIGAARLTAWASLALALALLLVACLPHVPPRIRRWRALFVLTGSSAMLCTLLLAFRVGL